MACPFFDAVETEAVPAIDVPSCCIINISQTYAACLRTALVVLGVLRHCKCNGSLMDVVFMEMFEMGGCHRPFQNSSQVRPGENAAAPW